MSIDQDEKDSTNETEAEEYTELFLMFSNWMESLLLKALVLTIAGLCLFQILLRMPALRGYIASTDRFEGVAIDRPEGR
ncbi:hypothetical protein [Paenibacillus lentus]|uniref:Uncharacterized protein n=1 Tax=Paenibacillus lentus TaxID=1338368 RepID=A0A3S8RVW8_9BACL|nr:hypothetical protein [Paenibacillus lentus]AZK47156.1 hypothetical protein EIM92_14110 [Paenibacillus lentus]